MTKQATPHVISYPGLDPLPRSEYALARGGAVSRMRGYTADQMRAYAAAAAELASMRQCFEAADRERSELRYRAARAEAERDALHAQLLPLLPLAQEVVSIAQHGCLLDGDDVNAPTLLWAEEWQRRILGPNAEVTG